MYLFLSRLRVHLGSRFGCRAFEVQYGGWPWEGVNGTVDSDVILIGAYLALILCSTVCTCSLASILGAWPVDHLVEGWSVHHPRCVPDVGCTETDHYSLQVKSVDKLWSRYQTCVDESLVPRLVSAAADVVIEISLCVLMLVA